MQEVFKDHRLIELRKNAGLLLVAWIYIYTLSLHLGLHPIENIGVSQVIVFITNVAEVNPCQPVANLLQGGIGQPNL